MADPIEFWFDFTSPYGYLASERIEAVAERHGRELVWRPVLLGAIFKTTGGAPLTEAPMKGPYSLHDFARSAREHGIAFAQPATFPVGAVAAKRAVVHVRGDAALADRTAALVHATYRAYFVEGRDITDVETVLDLAAGVGVDRDALRAALGDRAVKDALRVEVETALERGVFGSPTMALGDELFWGNDRVDMLDRWLERGGW